MRGEATETVTYKCEGCGERKPAGTQLSLDPEEYRSLKASPTVCSEACIAAALALYVRQRYDNRILALVGN